MDSVTKVELFLLFIIIFPLALLGFKIYQESLTEYIVYDETPVICKNLDESYSYKIFTNCEDGNNYINPLKFKEIKR